MSETKHAMKLRHKAELKALAAQPAKGQPRNTSALLPPVSALAHLLTVHRPVSAGIGAKKKQKDDEKLMLQRHELELKALDLSLHSKADEPPTSSSASDPPTTDAPQTDAKEPESAAAPAEDVGEAAVQGVKVSKAQQKRDKKAAAERERRAQVASSVEHMADPRKDESAALQRSLAPQRLTVREVLSDGSCLFRAVSTQLPPGPPARAMAPSPLSLRRAAASHIRSRLALYLPFLTHEDGSAMSEEEAVEYTARLSVDEGSDVVWGGHAEIVALSGVLGRAIVVYSAEGGAMRVLEEGVQAKGEDVRISFHKHYFGLGNHYNAVVQRTAADEDEGEGALDAATRAAPT